MVVTIPVEIARIVIGYVEDKESLLNLLLASHAFHCIAEPYLYIDVTFLGPTRGEDHWGQREGRSDTDVSAVGHGFLRSITAGSTECAHSVKRIRLPAVAFRREQYTLFQTILKSVPNLEDLQVHSSWWREGSIPFNLRTFLECSQRQRPPLPFTLKSFAWYTRDVQPDSTGLEWFLTYQRSLECLHLPWLRMSDSFPRIPTLPRLRVLHTSTTDVAKRFLRANQVTHLMLELGNRLELDEAALCKVEVWGTRISDLDKISEAAIQMSNLECLEMDTFYLPIPEILSRVGAFKGATKLRHLRIFVNGSITPPSFGRSHIFESSNPWKYDDVVNAFNNLPSLAHISVRVVPAATFPEFYCFTRGVPWPLKLRSLRPGVPEYAWYEWWQDWIEDYTIVPFEPSDPRMGYQSDLLP